MTNVDLMYLEPDRRLNWFKNYYFEVEQLLLRTAEGVLAQMSSG
jgi:hypothetical protein